MNTIIVFSILVFIAGIVIGIIKAKDMELKNKAIKQYCGIRKIDTSVFFHNQDIDIVFDEQTKKIYDFTQCTVLNADGRTKLKTQPKEIPFSDILSTELSIDGETIVKTARGSQLLGAAVGGVMLGGVGAVIGGLSGKKTEVQKIKTIKVKLLINDFKNPQIEYIFNDGKMIEAAEQLNNLFKVSIENSDKALA